MRQLAGSVAVGGVLAVEYAQQAGPGALIGGGRPPEAAMISSAGMADGTPADMAWGRRDYSGLGLGQ